LKPASVSTKQERIAKLARENSAMAFTSLNHYLDVEWMEYAFECTRKDGAVGVDGQTAEEYAVNLRHNLTDLIDRLKSGRYRAPPLRRHYIDKAGGGKRGLAIPRASLNPHAQPLSFPAYGRKGKEEENEGARLAPSCSPSQCKGTGEERKERRYVRARMKP